MPYNTVIVFVAFDPLPAADLNSNFANLDYLLAHVNPRVVSISSSATPTIDTDSYDFVDITALATNITSMTTNLSGTPVNMQKLIVQIKDNGVARTITWGASFVADGVALPSTTVAGKRLKVGFLYQTSVSKWGCVAAINET